MEQKIFVEEKRNLFGKLCEVRSISFTLLYELFIEKYLTPNQTIVSYFSTNKNVIEECTYISKKQRKILYPKGGTIPDIKSDLDLLCSLIRNLPLASSKESAQGDDKDTKNRYISAARDIAKILEKTYDKCYNDVDTKTLEEETQNLRDICKSVANDLPQEKRVTFFQSIDGEAQVPNTSSNPDTTNCKEECVNFEENKEHVEIPVQNWRYGRIMPQHVNTMEEYCKRGSPIPNTKSVYEWENKSSKKKYLIKKLVLTDEDENNDLRERYYRELYHEPILHPHVLPIISYAQSKSQYPRVMYLMYPYMENGSVRTNIERENKGEQFRPNENDCNSSDRKPKESNSTVWIRCIYQVASALDYLHNIGKHGLRGPVFHRNLTSSTIYFNEFYNAKLCDFGRAVEANHNAVEATDIPYFSAPGYHPRMTDTKRYKASYDVYSLCVVILEILTGELVGDDNTFSDPKSYPGYDCLLSKIENRPEVAKWLRTDLRDNLAKKAWDMLRMNDIDMTKVKANDVLKIINNDRVESYHLYKEETTNCVSCVINKRATTLPLKGKNCNDCKMFCVHCLTDYHNELICPQHGPSTRPFGDRVYGVFVAGNHVDKLSSKLAFDGNTPKSAKDIAKIFIRDAKKLANILTTKFPLVLGARPDHFEVVTPKKPGKEDTMKRSIEEAFKKIKKLIKYDLQDNQDKTNPLFIFYFSGHSGPSEGKEKVTHQNPKEHVLYLGGESETITTKCLREMLYSELFVDNVLVVLDCCYASGHDFVNKSEKSRFQISQLSSCDKTVKSKCDPTRGSYFTHLLCQALTDIKSHEHGKIGGSDCVNENNCPFPCKPFHVACSVTQKVTLTDVEQYIQNHYEHEKLKTDVKKHAMNAGSIELAYYKNLNKKQTISIRLEGSESGKSYSLSEVPVSIFCLRKDIVKYIDETKIQCQIHDMLNFYIDLNESADNKKGHKYVIKYTTRLVAIYQQNEQETKEVTCLDDLWKISPSMMSLVAKIRQDVNGLRNGHLKYDRIRKAMITNWQESYFNECLGISQDCMLLVCNGEERVIILKKIEKMESAKPKQQFYENKWLLNNLYQLIMKCQSAGAFDETERNILKFLVYDSFSILQFQ
ncbi:hypothetical protein ACJMK2_039258 [Sinanodonta woodiana]|uniref:Protein kinase domain-containing protein n=1 Tax=Sinanodonta woodiana TaxID=1069815 RepID=A0ABD3WBF1_SINWO